MVSSLLPHAVFGIKHDGVSNNGQLESALPEEKPLTFDGRIPGASCGENPLKAVTQRRGKRSGSVRHHTHMGPAIRAGNISSWLGAGGCPLRQFSILAGATLCVSPARPTRGSVPSTPDRSTFPTGFADRRLSPGWTTHLPCSRCRGGSAVPTGRAGSESDVAAPVNPTRSWRRAWPSRKGSLVREQPRRRWRVVKTHSPLRRTEPSTRGVAPATVPVAGAPPRTRRRCRQDVAAPADKQLVPV